MTMKYGVPASGATLTLAFHMMLACNGGASDGPRDAGATGTGGSAAGSGGARAGGSGGTSDAAGTGGAMTGGSGGTSDAAGTGGTMTGGSGGTSDAAGTGGAMTGGSGGTSDAAGTGGAMAGGSGGTSDAAGTRVADAAVDAGAVTYDWVLTAFTNQSESNMYVYRSDDGRSFNLVKGPAYTPPAPQLVRDPSVMQYNGRYYLVYTTGWREQQFGIAYSTDLQTWTFLTTVPTLGNATSSWAPEWFVEDGSFHVVISISTTGDGNAFGNFAPHLFTAQSADLMSWDGGVKMAGIEPNYIDTFVVRSGVTYHAFTKNENTKLIEHATASALAGPYTFVGTGDWAGWGSTAVEGPCLFQLANGTWRMLVDGYMSSQYLYSDSQDLVRWSPRQALPGGLSGFIRHGTVLRRVVEPRSP